jgi:hypothetical protein
LAALRNAALIVASSALESTPITSYALVIALLFAFGYLQSTVTTVATVATTW